MTIFEATRHRAESFSGVLYAYLGARIPSMLLLWDELGIPPTQVPISLQTFISYVIPPVACYFVAAVLVITPQTRAIRVALWPIIALLAFRAAVSVDISHGKPEQKCFNVQLLVCVFQHELSPRHC